MIQPEIAESTEIAESVEITERTEDSRECIKFRNSINVTWIMTRITIASFSVCINEEVCGFFKGGRGLRQGDPISPYLFTLVMEVVNMNSTYSINSLFWASVYMLPIYVIKELEILFKRFLWNAGNSAQGKARVAWNLVCRPKEQGVLGIKPLKSNSGPLDNIIPKRSRYEARMKDSDTVADLILDEIWLWPNEWFRLYSELNYIAFPTISQSKDSMIWIDDSNKEVEFSVSND
ncbi:hypothetical protein Tco_0790676 [Tanacetum coccineum]